MIYAWQLSNSEYVKESERERKKLQQQKNRNNKTLFGSAQRGARRARAIGFAWVIIKTFSRIYEILFSHFTVNLCRNKA